MPFISLLGDVLACTAARLLTGFLNCLPVNVRLSLVSGIVRLVLYCSPRFARTARRNLAFVFPDKSAAERENLLKESCQALARVFVDFARLPNLDRRWMKEHVHCAYLARLDEIKRHNPEARILIATGHLGSFELLAHYSAVMGHPLSFVVRDFKLPRLDRWWRSIREAHGNRVISRKGSFDEVLADLRAGRIVGLLFDQNVTRNHAVFVDWFGRPAATTRAVALAAVRTKAIILVAGIVHETGDNYRIDVIERDFTAFIEDQNLELDQKVIRITEIISRDYQQMILQKPASWFWMHRRWKTTPPGTAEDFYD